MCVRSPASRSRSSRSSPIAPPSAAASTMRRTTSAQERSARHRLHSPLLSLADVLDACGRQIEELVELVAGVALALRSRLHLDQPPVAVLMDDAEVDPARVLHSRGRGAPRRRRSRARRRRPNPSAPSQGRSGRARGATPHRRQKSPRSGTAVRLEHVTVDPERALAEGVQVGHGAERAPDQALDLHRPPFLPAGARLARRAPPSMPATARTPRSSSPCPCPSASAARPR